MFVQFKAKGASRAGALLLLCAMQASNVLAGQSHRETVGTREARLADLKFTHLTTNDGLSQSYVTAILQDRRGFMWFATRDGLNRYDGYTFVVYKHDPNDPRTLNSNFLQDLFEDDHGHLWISTNTGLNEFDPVSDRFTRYVHDPKNAHSLGSTYISSIAGDSRQNLWLGTQNRGLDKLNLATGQFTHYPADRDGQFVGRISHVISDRDREIWFVGERGLFHWNAQAGHVAHAPGTGNDLSAESVYGDDLGSLWMLTNSPIVGLVRYEPHSQRLTRYPFPVPAVGPLASTKYGGSLTSRLAAAGQNGLWVPSSHGLYYFDRKAERFTRLFQHDEKNPGSLDSNAIMSVYQDKSGVLWVGTENNGINLLNFRQDQFVHYRHRSSDPDSLSPGRVKAIHPGAGDTLWIGMFPRALDRLDRRTGRVTHYRPGNDNGLGSGMNVTSLYQDVAGNLWVGGGDSGVTRLDQRTGRFRHYRHQADNPNSLISDNVFAIHGDRQGRIWVGQQGGISRFDPGTNQFVNFQPVPDDPAHLANTVWIIYEDRSGSLWFGTWGGELIRFDEPKNTFVRIKPDLQDPHRLNGAGIISIHEDRAGTLWVGAFDGLYRYNRQSDVFTRYTESDGLPSSSIRCIKEDSAGRLWLSTQKGVSRFDPKLGTFRNYDVSDGLQSNEFSDGCYQSRDGEIFFGGSNGFNAFFPERIRDNPYVPPVAITSFKIFNNPVPIGGDSVLKQSIAYVESLTLSHRDNVFSFEFAALSYVNSPRNRYRYKLENFDRGWTEVSSKQRVATYTNLDPGQYVFRVQGSNCDGVWNEQGVSLPLLITPPWYLESWFRILSAALFVALLWAAYQFRMWQVQLDLNKLRDVIDTIPAMAWTALPDGSKAFVNKRWKEYTGLSAEYVAGSGWTEAVHADDRQAYWEKWRASLATGDPFECEARFRSAADGEYRWLLARAVPIRDNHRRIVRWYGILTDIESRKRAEEQRKALEADLAHMNRVSLMGELSASIAHEINQPLSGIVSNASACQRWLAGSAPNLEEVREAIYDIVRDGKRAGEVVAGIRAMTKRSTVAANKLDLNATIRDVLVLAGDQAKRSGVVIHTQFGADVAPVAGDRVQVQQVVLNLVMNAIEAMSNVIERTRELILTTRNLEPDEVEVTVDDSGIGIEPAKIDKVFESFFTTKTSGMGMGLSISRSIIDAHGGRIWAVAKDRGTSFHFTLPKYREEGPNAGVRGR